MKFTCATRFFHNDFAIYPQYDPQVMKLKPEQTDKLANRLLANFQAKELITLKSGEADIKAKIRSILSQNFAEEEVIENEARKMLASHAGEVREMDHYKMFMLIKQKIAAKKGFIL